MTQAVAAATLLAAGIATRYDPDVMQAVVANRIEWGQLEPSPEAVGFVALLDCEHIGKTVWLETPDGLLFRVQVADCAAGQDRARLVQDFTQWVDLKSGSRRLGRATPAGGFVGVATYEAGRETWQALLPYLLWGQEVHVGKSATKGDGWYEVRIASGEKEGE